MVKSLVDLPSKSNGEFLHPESPELILTLVAAGFAFSFWNTINIKPSMLTDTGYQKQREGLFRNMNLTLAAILGMSVGLGMIYHKIGYIPAMAMAGTGIGMYCWSAAELNRNLGSGEPYAELFKDVSVNQGAQSVLFSSTNATGFAISPKRRREHAA